MEKQTLQQNSNSQINPENQIQGVKIIGKMIPEYADILTNEALQFIANLMRKFNGRRLELLSQRNLRQDELNDGKMPDFLHGTKDIRNGDWNIASFPSELVDRRVEITGPVERKMIINALNSGSNMFMADFEDSLSPTWDNVIRGQINLKDAINKSISFMNPNGKFYSLHEKTATLLVRPRGWHLEEKNVRIDGKPVSGSLFDFGLYFFHNVKTLLSNGTGPYFYLPKLENHLEARLWNDVFLFAQNELGISKGTIKATVLIEHILAAFEMDEILYELKEHSIGLNCGRWDYIFSFIKKFHQHSDFLLPDRAAVSMNRHFLKSYVDLLIKTCHKRGAHAMGGMAAQIPIKHDQEANSIALQNVKEDKLREVTAGHDGTWVAHPGLISLAKNIFDEHVPTPNQIQKLRNEVNIQQHDLLKVPSGDITENGLRSNISIGIQYLESWLGGNGCVPLNFLMEDAATAEISRTQVWQWLHHSGGVLTNGKKVDKDLILLIMTEELEKMKITLDKNRFDSGKFEEATTLFEKIILKDTLDEFLTLSAYETLE